MIAWNSNRLNAGVTQDSSLLLHLLVNIDDLYDLYQIPETLMHDGLKEKYIVMLKNQHQNLVGCVLYHIYSRLILKASFKVLNVCVENGRELV